MADLRTIKRLANEIIAHPSAQGHVVTCAEGILVAVDLNEEEEALKAEEAEAAAAPAENTADAQA